MMSYVPFAALFFILIWFGMNDLYQWSHKETAVLDPMIQHKSGFLNVPFFFARMVVYFVLWIMFIRKLRQISLQEDMADPANTAVLCTYLVKPNSIQKYLFSFLLLLFHYPQLTGSCRLM